MQCENCGYIFFQPSKKCACCSAPYAPVQSAFEVGQENLFTIFEMAPGEGGIPGGMGMAGAGAGLEDYNFTDDFGAGGAEYGVDENVLDLSDAEAEGFGANVTAAGAVSSMGLDDFGFDTSGMDDMPNEGDEADDFELNLTEDQADDIEISTGTLETNDADMDLGGGFDDEVEGLGFGFDEPSADTTGESAGEIYLETSSEPELELATEEPSLELSEEMDLDIGDDQPSLELSDEPELSEDPALDMDDLDEGPSLELSDDLDLDMDATSLEEESGELDEEGGIEFDLDSVDLDTPEAEQVTYEVPEAEPTEPPMDFDDLELEMETPEEPEDEDLKQ